MDYDRLRELQEKFEENPRRYFAPLANEYRKGGQPKRAIEICRAQLAQMPGHMSGQIVYGQALYEAGEFGEARQVFERALTLDPENLIALRSLGDMSLQSGNTTEARSWYTRLLDADPKDTAVIALVAEIDASAEAVTPVPEEIPGVDTDAGDQAIPFIADAAGEPVAEGTAVAPPPPEAAPAAPAPEPEPIAPETIAPAAVPSSASAPPEGLERHYPVESPESVEPVASPEPVETIEALEAIVPGEPMGAEGLQSKAIPTEPVGAEGLHAQRPSEPVGTEGLSGREPEGAVPEGTEGLKGTPAPTPLAGATASRSDDDEALDTWTPPPGAAVHEQKAGEKEERMFSGPAPEPFVNETMAQLYLQQGYRQLALRVYYQLVEARPNDQALKDRIAQIEAEDRAAHPEAPPVPRAHPEAAPAQRARPEAAPVARREPAPIEAPPPAPTVPRSPSIETPTPGGAPESEEAPGFDQSPVDSPPPARPSRERESIESPDRDEPRAEPEGIAARQPSIREFFATLGRRRPPRTNAAPPSPAPPARTSNSVLPEPTVPLGGAAPSATLDAVFAGATVNPADSRAASRLAGAFSGTVGTSRTTPPTPPMPTPRVNPRIPAAQESEEDVAKFRAWLDGLTGE
jgi:tetratricopeptide (TPR) repeat protein